MGTRQTEAGLKGAGGDRAELLDGMVRGGGSGSIINDIGLVLGNETGFVLGKKTAKFWNYLNCLR